MEPELYELDVSGDELEVIEREGQKAYGRFWSIGRDGYTEMVAPLVRTIIALVVAVGAKSVREAVARAKGLLDPVNALAELGAARAEIARLAAAPGEARAAMIDAMNGASLAHAALSEAWSRYDRTPRHAAPGETWEAARKIALDEIAKERSVAADSGDRMAVTYLDWAAKHITEEMARRVLAAVGPRGTVPTIAQLEYTATASTSQPVTVAVEPLTEDEKREAHRFGKVTGIGFARAQEAIAETKAKRARRAVPASADVARLRAILAAAPCLDAQQTETVREIVGRLTPLMAAESAREEAIDAEDLWADYRTERPHLTALDRLAFLEGVAAARRTATPPQALTEAEAQDVANEVARALNARWSIGLGEMVIAYMAERLAQAIRERGLSDVQSVPTCSVHGAPCVKRCGSGPLALTSSTGQGKPTT